MPPQFTVSVLLSRIIQLGALLKGVEASSGLARDAVIKYDVRQLSNSSYDYIVVGGGTSGLVLANRLSEDALKTVLVVELGYFANEPCIWMPSGPFNCGTRYTFNESSAPQTELGGAKSVYIAGCAVGGSSAVNGMVFDRGTKADYDAWGELGNPGWGWGDLYPYFKKSTTFTPPDTETAKKYGYTWDTRAFGKGPIQASYPNFQWPTEKIMFDAWAELNITGPKEHGFGDALGRFWMPASKDPKNQTRSYSRYGYHDPASSRPNYHLLVGHKAERLVLSSDLAVEGVVIYQRDSPEQKIMVKAKREVILAAGAVHTPQILELSGIGSRKVLKAAGIEVKVDLPGVGENFQDHPQAHLVCNYTENLFPNAAALKTNTTPIHNETEQRCSFPPLDTVHSSPASYLSQLSAQAAGAYLPPSSPPEIVAGFEAQKLVLQKMVASGSTAIYEIPISGVCPTTTVLQKPLSRGTIHVNSSDPLGPPVIDWRTFTNPLDVENAVESIKFMRRYVATAKLKPLAPVESGPGGNISDTDVAGLEAWVKSTSGPTSFHACGTAAMMPRKLGGVIGSDLKVYGVDRLSVVDASLFPLIVGAHLSATVYAVAEKAAVIIKGRA
ncbi:hypothetical protein BCR34DRAFT_629048 [Clohesyomyces aquaticus]|uniref:Glucose-methanol-choline oxidoreductase N-terminal domain-containing protein n=1 Tax=Clohesyomyces aquaticus TaxID=1231657 RepID=A0A1Y1YC73_9PLEO|nr:hypothetical protein BCR34DRAFT_629048 [Clohesyomyces aquaticus]